MSRPLSQNRSIIQPKTEKMGDGKDHPMRNLSYENTELKKHPMGGIQIFQKPSCLQEKFVL